LATEVFSVRNGDYLNNMVKQLSTVLVIDDDRRILNRMAKMLQSIPYCRVICATNGSEGLSMLKAEAVSCVILDYQMPVMNGK